LIGTAAGVKTQYDGKYLLLYDPKSPSPDGTLDGGILEVTDDPAKALRFPSYGAVWQKYRETNGRMRVDGEPDRPLTAWTVSVEEVHS
jgi:hypothetical protein